jgi:hypothetical protein
MHRIGQAIRLDKRCKLSIPYLTCESTHSAGEGKIDFLDLIWGKNEERLNMNQDKDGLVMLKTIEPQPVQTPSSC